jgi:hypothetical protein
VNIHSRTYGAIARTAAMTAATGVVLVALANPASAQTYDKWIAVDCPPPFSQTCSKTAGIEVPGSGGLFVTFTGDPGSCAAIIEHVIVNGKEWASSQVGPGQNDGGFFIGASDYPQWPDRKAHVAIQADGVLGGCNTGSMSGWAGNLHVENGDDALNGAS